MDNKIRDFVEAMFAGLPKSREVVEAKLGIIETMQDKYEALLSEGKNKNEAFGTVISEFGSIDELRRELGISQEDATKAENDLEYQQFCKHFAVASTVAVALYIAAPLLFLLFEPAGQALSFTFFFLPIIVATGLFVYFGVQSERYDSKQGTKEKQEDPVTTVIFLAALVIFLLLGFWKNLWHPGWVIFLVAAMVNTLALMFRQRKSD
ncbi:permease prefix domain 1-containing protein [Ligaoa zhengdingensis]|uniref:permease prefix domain 1-containing protein n=1 Tax=Ligaoa zhengdingensis TaxID=2763658 RepID=UPI0031BADB2C